MREIKPESFKKRFDKTLKELYPITMRESFQRLLEKRWEKGFFVCIGLDSELGKIPKAAQTGSVKETLLKFNREIIEATGDLVCAYKPNVAFYEAEGPQGLEALISTVGFIHATYPEVPVILDAKRADIGHTNAAYVKAMFDIYGGDALTVHPYVGQEALQTFLDRKEKGIFVLCRTSNPGAGEFQDLQVLKEGQRLPLYQVVAQQVATKWNRNQNCGLVVGASYPRELKEIRWIAGDLPVLLPGIGAQGAELTQALAAGLDSKGTGLIVNASRSIIFASSEADFALAARRETENLHKAIQQYRLSLNLAKLTDREF